MKNTGGGKKNAPIKRTRGNRVGKKVKRKHNPLGSREKNRGSEGAHDGNLDGVKKKSNSRE